MFSLYIKYFLFPLVHDLFFLFMIISLKLQNLFNLFRESFVFFFNLMMYSLIYILFCLSPSDDSNESKAREFCLNNSLKR